MESLNLKRTMYLTEDEIRDNAKVILGFDEKDPNVKQGTGQITTFNQLGFKGVSDKPDGWYLPNDKQDIAIILETKSEKEDVFSEKHYAELVKNIEIAALQYKRVVGILYTKLDMQAIVYFLSKRIYQLFINPILLEQSDVISFVLECFSNIRYFFILFASFDGWYLPNDKQDIAIILETKSEKEDVFSEKHYAELEKNIEIAALQYKRVVGILTMEQMSVL